MSSNHKLTAVLMGRTIVSTQNQNDTLHIGFDDGSFMTVKTHGATNTATTGGKIRAVQQDAATLSLDFENDSSLDIPTSGPTSSVMVRDKNHVLEYAD